MLCPLESINNKTKVRAKAMIVKKINNLSSFDRFSRMLHFVFTFPLSSLTLSGLLQHPLVACQCVFMSKMVLNC